MTQILSAAHKPYSRQQFLAAELEVLMKNIKGDTKTKHKHAKKILKALLRTKVNPSSEVQKALLGSAIEVAQSYNRPDIYPNQTSVTGVNDNAKDIPPQPQSKYQTRQECVQSFVNNNFSLAAANDACDQYFPRGPASKGGVERREVAHGWNGGTSVLTTHYPGPHGFKKNPETLKQASTDEVPAWIRATLTEGEVRQIENQLSITNQQQTSPMRSATRSEIDEIFYNTSIAAILERHREERTQRREDNLKSARVKDDEISDELAKLWCGIR